MQCYIIRSNHCPCKLSIGFCTIVLYLFSTSLSSARSKFNIPANFQEEPVVIGKPIVTDLVSAEFRNNILIKNAIDLKDTLLLLKAYNNKYYIELNRGNQFKLKEVADLMLTLAEQIGDKKCLAEANYIMAGYWTLTNRKPNAWPHYLKALQYASGIPHCNLKEKYYLGISNYLHIVGYAEMEIKYLELALENASDSTKYNALLFDLGIAHLETNVIKGSELVNRAITHLAIAKDPLAEDLLICSKSKEVIKFYLAAKRFKEAEQLCTRIFNSNNENYINARKYAIEGMAEIAFQASKLKNAKTWAEIGLTESTLDHSGLSRLHYILYEYYKTVNQSKSLLHFRKYMNFKDSLRFYESINAINNYEIKIIDQTFQRQQEELLSKEQELLSISKNEKTKKTYLSVMTIFLLLLGVILTVVILKVNGQKRKLEFANENLRFLVREKKEKYGNTINLLTRHYQSMDEFILIVSHYLSKPIDSLCTLIDICRYDRYAVKAYKIIEIMRRPSVQLLSICSLMNRVLSNNPNLYVREWVSLKDVISKVQLNVEENEKRILEIELGLETESIFTQREIIIDILSMLISHTLHFGGTHCVYKILMMTFKIDDKIVILITNNEVNPNWRGQNEFGQNSESEPKKSENNIKIVIAKTLMNMIGGSLVVSSMENNSIAFHLGFPTESCVTMHH